VDFIRNAVTTGRDQALSQVTRRGRSASISESRIDLESQLPTDSIRLKKRPLRKSIGSKLPSMKKALVTLVTSNLMMRGSETVAACGTDALMAHWRPTYRMDDTFYTDKVWIEPFPKMMDYLEHSADWQSTKQDIMSSGHQLVTSRARFTDGNAMRVGSKVYINMQPDVYGEMNQDQEQCIAHSVAMIFGHEAKHAEWLFNNPVGSAFLGIFPDSDHGTFEEYRATDKANIIAEQLGEPQRLSHFGARAPIPAKSISDNNNGSCLATYAKMDNPFKADRARFLGRVAFVKLFFNKNFPYVKIHTLLKAHEFIARHNEIADTISTQLKNPQITDEERRQLKLQWDKHRDNAVAFAETFTGILANSYTSCPLPKLV